MVLSESIESISLPERGVYQRPLDFSLAVGTYLIADCGGIRTTRYALDDPIPALSEADYSVETSQDGANLHFTVTARNLIIDLSLIAELLAKDLIVDHQRLTLLPGESREFLVAAPSQEVAEFLVAADPRALFFSQNSLH